MKFATFNLYNLQLPGKPMYRGQTLTKAAYDAMIAWTAVVLKRINADLIGFQELWHPDALIEAFKAAGQEKSCTIGAKLVPGSISNAVGIEKEHTLSSKRWILPFPKGLIVKKREATVAGNVPDYRISVNANKFSRAILKAKINPKQGDKKAPEITFFVAHLKSIIPVRLESQESDIVSVRLHSTAMRGV